MVGFLPEGEAVRRKEGALSPILLQFPSVPTLLLRTRKETRASPFSGRDEQAYLKRRCPW